MARFRLSHLAQADLAQILATSGERWGGEGRRRYTTLLISAMRRVAADPETAVSRNRTDLVPGVRSFHIRHASAGAAGQNVNRAVHILYYRSVRPGLIEIIRVLHERMEPGRHLGAPSEDNA